MSTARQAHILVMNNSQDVLALMAELLGDAGHRVTTMAFLSHDLNRVIELNPDAIVLDYMWGSDDSGWAFLQMLRLHPESTHIPIILCTGAVAQVRELDSVLEEMGVRVILKPFNIDQLVGEVNQALEGVDQRRSTGQVESESGTG